MQIYGKEITTIISDLDGTLLGQGTELEPALFPLIRQLKERGVSFVAASGRQYKNMQLLFEPIADEILFVCENGSLVVKNGKTVFARYMPRELCFELLADMFSIPGTETIVSSERNLYTLASRQEFIRRMNQFLRPDIDMVEDYRMITGRINKISIWWPEGIPDEKEKWFQKKYHGRLQVVDGGNGWLDFTAEGVNKGMALRELARLEGFSMEKALCFGDSENDIAMFQECAVSYAMATGREHVKAEADYICRDVGEMLRRFLAE